MVSPNEYIDSLISNPNKRVLRNAVLLFTISYVMASIYSCFAIAKYNIIAAYEDEGRDLYSYIVMNTSNSILEKVFLSLKINQQNKKCEGAIYYRNERKAILKKLLKPVEDKELGANWFAVGGQNLANKRKIVFRCSSLKEDCKDSISSYFLGDNIDEYTQWEMRFVEWNSANLLKFLGIPLIKVKLSHFVQLFLGILILVALYLPSRIIYSIRYLKHEREYFRKVAN